MSFAVVATVTAEVLHQAENNHSTVKIPQWCPAFSSEYERCDLRLLPLPSLWRTTTGIPVDFGHQDTYSSQISRIYAAVAQFSLFLCCDQNSGAAVYHGKAAHIETEALQCGLRRLYRAAANFLFFHALLALIHTNGQEPISLQVREMTRPRQECVFVCSQRTTSCMFSFYFIHSLVSPFIFFDPAGLSAPILNL